MNKFFGRNNFFWVKIAFFTVEDFTVPINVEVSGFLLFLKAIALLISSLSIIFPIRAPLTVSINFSLGF